MKCAECFPDQLSSRQQEFFDRVVMGTYLCVDWAEWLIDLCIFIFRGGRCATSSCPELGAVLQLCRSSRLRMAICVGSLWISWPGQSWMVDWLVHIHISRRQVRCATSSCPELGAVLQLCRSSRLLMAICVGFQWAMDAWIVVHSILVEAFRETKSYLVQWVNHWVRPVRFQLPGGWSAYRRITYPCEVLVVAQFSWLVGPRARTSSRWPFAWALTVEFVSLRL